MKHTNSSLPDGVFAANLTPQKSDMAIDDQRLVDHCRWLLANGCDGLAPMGTTGEANSFTVKERMALLETLIRGDIPPANLLVGTGCCAFPDTVELTKHALACGIGGVLVLPPFYYKQVSDDGILKVFDTIINQVGSDKLRIYLYHFPQMSGVPFSNMAIERLLTEFPTIIAGMKDSSGNWANMLRICQQFPDFRVYAGTERYLLDILKCGGAGCISATTNVTCPLAGQVFSVWQTPEALELQSYLTHCREALEAFPFIPALKQILADHTGRQDWLNMRPPHIPLNAANIKSLNTSLDNLNFKIDYT